MFRKSIFPWGPYDLFFFISQIFLSYKFISFLSLINYFFQFLSSYVLRFWISNSMVFSIFKCSNEYVILIEVLTYKFFLCQAFSHRRNVVARLVHLNFFLVLLLLFAMALYEFVNISFQFYGMLVIWKIRILVDTSINRARSICFWNYVVHLFW